MQSDPKSYRFAFNHPEDYPALRQVYGLEVARQAKDGKPHMSFNRFVTETIIGNYVREYLKEAKS